jgi:5-methylcytosine-specific restriction endonuclease McrA
MSEKYKDRGWLVEKYIREDMAVDEMAKLAECHHTTISRYLKQNGIQVGQPSGKEHYNWKGGRSENPHTAEWEKSREKAIERDFEQCRSCGITRDEHKDKFNQDIEVHHRTPRNWYFNEYSEEEAHKKMNELRNLITLCKPCHMQVERKIR